MTTPIAGTVVKGEDLPNNTSATYMMFPLWFVIMMFFSQSFAFWGIFFGTADNTWTNNGTEYDSLAKCANVANATGGCLAVRVWPSAWWAFCFLFQGQWVFYVFPKNVRERGGWVVYTRTYV
jgi:hypothetical protein